MATIQSQLKLNDGMTGVLRNITSALDSCLSSFEQMQAVSGQSMNLQAVADARAELSEANDTIEQMEGNLRQVEDQQNGVNRSFNEGTAGAGSLLGKITQMAAAYLSVRTAVNFVKDSIDLTNQQIRAEQQLKNVLVNQGASEADYLALKQQAATIQGTSMYDKTSMVGGAAELATYIKDADALQSMMGTLSNYAAGMSGGMEVSYQQMVDYATQLGKALDGTYDGLKKKGFELSDAQKEIIANGTDMEKALVINDVINQSWAGLSEQMAQTPEGMRVSMTNAFNEIRANLGAQLLPALMTVFQAIQDNMPKIEQLLNEIVPVIQFIINLVGSIIDVVATVFQYFTDNGVTVRDVVIGIAAAVIGWKLAQMQLNMEMIKNPVLLFVGLLVAALVLFPQFRDWILMAATAFGILNMVLNGNPIFLIITVIAMIIIKIIEWVNAVGGLKIAWLIVVNAILTAWDWVKIAFFTGIYFVLDLWDKMRLGMMTAGAAIANFMGDMRANVLMILQNMVNGAIDIINRFIGILNKIPGVNINLIEQVTFGTTAQLENEAAKQARMDNLGAYRSEIEAGIREREGKLQAMQDTAATAQADRLAEIANLQAAKAAGADETPTDPTSEWNANAQEQNGLLGDIADNTGSTAASLKNMSEELAYMRDIAEREAVNRFTTAEIQVDMTGMTNRIDSDMDVDGIISRFVDGITEELSVSAEGVHA